MFYSQHVLTKKGPLAKIWLAAHMHNKLTKAMVFSTNIQHAVSSILTPDVPMALRLTSNLLLGVVRILSRKTKYLLQESSDAMTRLKLTFRARTAAHPDALPTNVAPLPAITLPSIDALQPPNIDLHLVPSRLEPPPSSAFLAADRDITIHQFAGGLMGGIIDAFSLEPQLPRDADAALELDTQPLLFTPSQRVRHTPLTPSVRSSEPSAERLRAEDEQERAAESPAPPPLLSVERERLELEPEEEPSLVFGERVPSPPATPPAREAVPLPTPPMPESAEPIAPPSPMPSDAAIPSARISVGSDRLELQPSPPGPVAPTEPERTPPLSPLPPPLPPSSPLPPEPEPGQPPASPPTPRRGRKRKLYVLADEGATEISAAQFRAALNDTSDLLRQQQPVQRRRVRAGAAERFEQLISRPTVPLAPQLMQLFEANFRAHELIVASPISDADLGGEGEAVGEARKELEAQEEEEEELRKEREEVEAEKEMRVEKEVTADPSMIQLEETEAVVPRVEEEDIMPVAAVPAPRDTISPVLPPALPETEEPRAVSMGRESVAVSVAASIAADDEAQFTLRQVADTAAQVDGEQLVNEATVSARTRRMQEFIMTRLEEGEFDFSGALAEVGGRRTAARCFYELLNLSNKKALAVRQDEPYGTIWARPIQPTFNTLLQS